MGRTRTRRRAAVAGMALVAAILVTAAPAVAKPDGGRSKSETSEQSAVPAVVAYAVSNEVQVFATPGDATPVATLANPTTTDGQLVFLIDQLAPGGWLQALLPVKPNGTTGWIRASDVSLASNPYRIVVRLRAHRVTVLKNDEVVLRAPVAVGKRQTPTPGGRYYLTQLFEPPNPDGPYGPFAYSLSGFSEVLETFKGGDAIIGIHGTNQPDLVGEDVSHGCIRMTNDQITRLSKILPLGTPVSIRAR
jgi:lipoprotein-anchoring transpeptidase ErfK/SrfK